MKVEAPPLFVTFILVAGVATMGITMAVQASRQKPRAIEQFTKLTAPPAFEERFSEWTVVLPLAKKQDRLPPIMAGETPAAMPVEMAVARSDVPQTVGTTVSVRRHRNICQRHGMRKVKHGRYGWRCRK